MKNEAEFKTKFKKSVGYYNGFCAKLAAPMLAGIPDLYVIMPGYIPILLEAKWLGEIKRETFSRKLLFTELQKLFIRECNRVNAYSALGLVGCKYNNAYHAILVPCDIEQFSHLTHDFVTSCSYVPLDNRSNCFNVPTLFSGVPIPRIENVIDKDHIQHDSTGSEIHLAI